jgi:patatin-like phospholipase/acyl hydrolase
MHAHEEGTAFDCHSQEKIYFNKILNVFNNYVKRINLVSSGKVGEIIAQLILLLAFDNARRNSKQLFKNRLKAIYSYRRRRKIFVISARRIKLQ